MRIVVTGATGNIGSALLPRLTRFADVAGIARHVPTDGGVTWHAADIGAPGTDLTALFAGADAVVHLAWNIVAGHDRADQKAIDLYGTSAVAAAARAARVRHLVHLSSAAVYSPRLSRTPVTEGWRRRGIPESSYSRDKVAAEDLLDRVTGLRIARIRPPAVLQPSAAAGLARMALGFTPPVNRVPLLPLPARTVIQAIAADDVADLVVRVLRAGATGAFNAAGEPALSAPALASLLGGRHLPVSRTALRRLLAVTWGLRLQRLDASWANLLVDTPLLDCTRAREELGWRPSHDAREVVREARSASTR
ncbi:NAD-dependent epimerase/dehydratase family protein [Actinoplanes sp. NPDC023714]|uniref:NAD-dependent epimerase/dehydratase family protein n=1 Tax=Actinoplanes sp. NPDC023714 TaxID=3154322 RepID=UPI0033DE0C5B